LISKKRGQKKYPRARIRSGKSNFLEKAILKSTLRKAPILRKKKRGRISLSGGSGSFIPQICKPLPGAGNWQQENLDAVRSLPEHFQETKK